MPNIFYRITKKLSNIFNNFVAFTRIGNLLFTSHRYSTKELTDRAFILASTATMGYLGSRKEVTDSLNCPAVVGVAAGLATGFTISHAVVIAPLIHKRMQFRQNCEQTKTKIIELLDREESWWGDSFSTKQHREFKTCILKEIEYIYKVDYSTDKRANSSLTWGKRARRLEELYNKLLREAAEELKDMSDGRTFSAP